MKDGFLENTDWRHVEALYGIFDRVRKRFPKVIFQNCAGGGGRLDYGIMRRFQNTELSDWLRAPRGLKILNGMTWVLPPEILLRTFGTESDGLEEDGDVDVQLRTTMLSRPIFRGSVRRWRSSIHCCGSGCERGWSYSRARCGRSWWAARCIITLR